MQEKATRSIKETIHRLEATVQTAEDYTVGAKLYAKFIKRPERYKGREAVLRVRMEGRYGDARLREEVYEAFNMPIGDALYLNDLFVLGSAVDVEKDGWLIDAWAEGEAADWLDDNGVTTGTTFEAKFRFAHEIVKDGGHVLGGAPRDVYQAKLIMINGIRVLEKEPQKPMVGTNSRENKTYINSDIDMSELPADVVEFIQNLLAAQRK